jgi:hypothetical protein
MAKIRIVDEWLRSPVSPPYRYRVIMVVADAWSEQRVLMRAFADSSDQTRPTIVLHGAELAVGPAGTDPHGPWGIHVEPPVDGRAQELRAQLELAARRLAGAKGNPPRLQDEAPDFERKRTNHWAPGTPPDLPRGHAPASAPSASQTVYGNPAAPGYYEPAKVAQPTSSPVIPSAAPRAAAPGARTVAPVGGGTLSPVAGLAPPGGPPPTAPPAQAPRRRRGYTSPLPLSPAREVGGRTQAGFAPGIGAAPRRSRRTTGAAPSPGTGAGRRLDSLINHTMQLGFRLEPAERDVLNALGEARCLTARHISEIAGVADAMAWMEQLMSKLADHGLDLVGPGDDQAGEPTYVLRR